MKPAGCLNPANRLNTTAFVYSFNEQTEINPLNKRVFSLIQPYNLRAVHAALNPHKPGEADRRS